MRRHLTRENVQLVVFIVVFLVGARLIADVATNNAKDAALQVWESQIKTCRDVNNPNRIVSNNNFSNLKEFENAAVDTRRRSAREKRSSGDDVGAALDEAAADQYRRLAESVSALEVVNCDKAFPKP